MPLDIRWQLAFCISPAHLFINQYIFMKINSWKPCPFDKFIPETIPIILEQKNIKRYKKIENWKNRKAAECLLLISYILNLFTWQDYVNGKDKQCQNTKTYLQVHVHCCWKSQIVFVIQSHEVTMKNSLNVMWHMNHVLVIRILLGIKIYFELLYSIITEINQHLTSLRA